MTPRDLAYEALSYIAGGNTATISTASSLQLGRIVRDINATLEKIYSLAPAIYKRRDGAQVKAPLPTQVAVINGSTAMTCSDTLVDGSTIKIEGDPEVFNEVRLQSGSKYLRIPFNGPTGTYAALVWGDAVPVDATVDRVIGAVRLNEKLELDPRMNRMDSMSRRFPEPDYGRRLRVLSVPLYQGQPIAYWVEPVAYVDGTPANSKSYFRIRLYPLPPQTYSLGFDVRVKPTKLAAADLGTDSADSTAVLPIAADMHEAVLLPLFLKRWARSPWFKDKDKLASIDADAQEAMALLQSYRVQQPSNRRLIAPL